jgi:peptidoglycan/xylan/chitin deacetylase (PgdA/CDA1 family)
MAHQFLESGYLVTHESIYRLLAALPAPARQSWSILAFHRIVPDENFEDASVVGKLAVTLSDFRAILDWLVVNTVVVSLDDGLSALQKKRLGERRPMVSLTFDDGYQDNLTLAVPELTSRQLPGTFYVATGYLGGKAWYWWDVAQLWARQEGLPSSEVQRTLKRMHGLPRREETERMSRAVKTQTGSPEYLTSEDVRLLSSLGMTVGNHTVSHPELDRLSLQETALEIVSAHSRLAGLLPAPPRHFAFPEGIVAPAADEPLRSLGYRTAATMRRGRNHRGTDCFRLRRIDGRYLVGDRGFSEERARFWVSSGLGRLSVWD